MGWSSLSLPRAGGLSRSASVSLTLKPASWEPLPGAPAQGFPGRRPRASPLSAGPRGPGCGQVSGRTVTRCEMGERGRWPGPGAPPGPSASNPPPGVQSSPGAEAGKRNHSPLPVLSASHGSAEVGRLSHQLGPRAGPARLQPPPPREGDTPPGEAQHCHHSPWGRRQALSKRPDRSLLPAGLPGWWRASAAHLAAHARLLPLCSGR